MPIRFARVVVLRGLLLAGVCCLMGALIGGATSQPVQARSKAKSRGAELFATKGCAHCHGEGGVGGGRGPDLQLVRKRRDAESIAQQIHDGGMGMPPYGDQLTPREIKDLVAYLRARRTVVQVTQKPGEASPAATNE